MTVKALALHVMLQHLQQDKVIIMPTTSERTIQRAELVSQGYSWEYVDGHPPKVTLYRHAPKLNTAGLIVEDVGVAIKGIPGNPDYVLRKAKIGLFNRPPGNGCECKWCRERAASSTPKRDNNGKFVKKK